MMTSFLIYSGYSYYNKYIKESTSSKNDDDASSSSSSSPSSSSRVPPTTSTLKEYIVNYILCPSLAGIIMHGPGLYVKFHYEDTIQYIQSLVGASFEGVFLLLLATRALHAGKSVHDYLQQQTNYSSSSSSSSNKVFIVQKLYVGCGVLLAASYFGFIFSVIQGDAQFRIMSGNDNVSADEIRAGSECGMSCAIMPFQADLVGALCRSVFGIVCLGGSLVVYHYPSLVRRIRKRCRDTTTPSRLPILLPIDSSNIMTLSTSSSKSNGSSAGGGSRPKSLQVCIIGLILCFCTILLNSMDWYTPVVHAYIAFVFVFNSDEYSSSYSSSEGSSNSSATDPSSGGGRVLSNNNNLNSPPIQPGAPNIIFIQHDSFSGSAFLDEHGKKAMPFLHDKMQNDPDMYVFEHAMTGGAITMDAIPALMTGCLPYTHEGVKWVRSHGKGIGHNFKQRGYKTASLLSAPVSDWSADPQGGAPWKSKQDTVFDLLADPGTMNWPKDNGEGCDDRLWLPVFENWLQDLDNSTNTNAKSPKEERSSFYTQIYSFNVHYPYLKDPKNEAQPHRYYDSMLTLDESIKGIFDILERTGRLDNTIIVGVGDHGEDPFKKAYVRLGALNSNLLHTGSYIYYPSSIMPDRSVGERLRYNTQKMTYTQDMYPTIQSILNGSGKNNVDHLYTDYFHDGCITGVDLTTVEIPDDRVVISWNYVSQHKRQRGGDEIKARFWALTTRDSTGDELSLYHRRHPGPGRGLKQGTNNFYMLKHGNCTRSIDKSDLCMSDVTQEDKDIFRGAISRIKNGNFRYFNEGVKGSELIDFFDNMVGIEDEDSADDSPNVVKDMAGELASKDSKHEIVLNLDGNLRGTQADSKATDNKDVKDIEKLDTKNKNVSKNGKEEKAKEDKKTVKKKAIIKTTNSHDPKRDSEHNDKDESTGKKTKEKDKQRKQYDQSGSVNKKKDEASRVAEAAAKKDKKKVNKKGDTK